VKRLCVLSVTVLFLFGCASTPKQAVDTRAPQSSAVASAHPLATQAGMDILEKGGNAFDAAVAVTAALAVVEPYSSGIGGGGFWLIHRAKDGYQTMIDGRETMPSAGHRDMYLDKKGNVIPGLSMDGPLSAGIPGVPAAIAHMAEKYGTMPLTKTLAPAIRYAKEGFEVDEHYQRMAGFRKKVLQASMDSKKIFLRNGEVPPVGFVIKQPDLAVTIATLAKKGHDGFYKGGVARQLVRDVKSNGGIWSMEDMANYKVVEREPIVTEYKGVKITSAPPPSSGGVALAEMFNILSAYDLPSYDRTTRKHLIVEAMRRAYRDRAIYLGDPDFVKVPMEKLTNQLYADGLRASIRADKATKSKNLPGIEASKEGFHTTHFSILDKEGNRVSATVTVNYPFGSGFTAQGTGVLLNDEMDDFSTKPGVPNAYGLVGAEANAIEPNKRPLSSMTPTFLETKDGLAILGTPGGSRIITMVFLGAMDFMEGNTPDSWVSLPRYHHQYLPDKIQYEEGALSAKEKKKLQSMGHELEQTRWKYGNMQAILWDKQTNIVSAASDPRGVGDAKTRVAH